MVFDPYSYPRFGNYTLPPYGPFLPGLLNDNPAALPIVPPMPVTQPPSGALAREPRQGILDLAGADNHDRQASRVAQTVARNGLLGYTPGDLIDMSSFPARLAQAGALLAPQPFGSALGLGNAILRGRNLAITNEIRKSLGMAPLSDWQGLGAIFGLNDYGMGKLIAHPEYSAAIDPLTGARVGVSIGGMYTDTGLLGTGLFGGQPILTRTPEEMIARQLTADALAGKLSGGSAGGAGRAPATGYGPSGERGPGGLLSGADKMAAHYSGNSSGNRGGNAGNHGGGYNGPGRGDAGPKGPGGTLGHI